MNFVRNLVWIFIWTPILAWGEGKDPHLEEVKKVMQICTSMTQRYDWRERDLSYKVQNELGVMCTIPAPSKDSISLINRQMDTVFAKMDEEELWRSVNTIALERTTKSIWASRLKLIKNEKLNEASAEALICENAPKLCLNSEDKQTIKKSWKAFEEMAAKQPIKFLSGEEQDLVLKKELKPIIEHANKTCAATRRKYLEIKEAFSCYPAVKYPLSDLSAKVTLPKRPPTQEECQKKLNTAETKHTQLLNLANSNIELDMQRIVNSQLGSLLITRKLRETLGVLKDDSVYDNCMVGDGNIFNTLWNKDIIAARSDFYALTISELRKIENYRQDYFDAEKRKTLKQYLKTNPSTVAELLRRKPHPNVAWSMCSLIRSIQRWDQASVITDRVLEAAGVITSVALGFTGIGAPAAGAILGLVIAKKSLQIISSLNQDQLLSSSVATKQKDLDQALVEFQTSAEYRMQLKSDMVVQVVQVLPALALTKSEKILKALKSFQKIGTGLKVADEAVIIKTFEDANKVFLNNVKNLGASGEHLAKLPIKQEVKITEVISKLGPQESKIFTMKLAELKDRVEMTSFINSLAKSDGLLVKSKFDINILNKLVDGSKKIPPMRFQIANNSKTSNLFVKLTENEKDILIKTATDVKKAQKLSDVQIMDKIAKVQKECLSLLGNLKKGCLELQLGKIFSNEATRPGIGQRFLASIKQYGWEVRMSNGKRFFTEVRNPHWKPRNRLENAMDFMNNPHAHLYASKWQVTNPVSMSITSSLLYLWDYAGNEVSKNASADTMGGPYTWEFQASGILSADDIINIVDEHDLIFDKWLFNSLSTLPRLDELANIFKLSPGEKDELNTKARDLYLKELDLFVKTHPKSTNKEKLAFHESVREKFTNLINSINSLKRLDPPSLDLLSTAYYPLIKLGKKTDVSIIYNDLTRVKSEKSISSANVSESMPIGGEYGWDFAVSGIITSEEFRGVMAEHKVNLDNWIANKLTFLPRMDVMAKILKLSKAEKDELNTKARKMYSNTASEDELRFKLLDIIKGIPSLKRLSSHLVVLLSTSFYPVIKIETSSDVEQTHALITNASGTTSEIMARIEEGLPIPQALLMVIQQKKDPAMIKAKSDLARSVLPTNMQKVANRPDLPFIDPELKMMTKPGATPIPLKDEISRWKIIVTDPRFKDLYDHYKKGDMDQFRSINYFEKAVLSYNELYKIMEKETLDDNSVKEVLKNPFFEAVVVDFEKWSQDFSKNKILDQKKKEAVALWLKYHQELADGKKPVFRNYEVRYKAILKTIE